MSETQKSGNTRKTTARKPGRFAGRAGKRAKKRLIRRLIVAASVLIVIAALGFGARTVLRIQTQTTKLRFADIGELATQSAIYTTVDVLEKAQELLGVQVPFTQSKSIYSYSGVIKAGIDFSQIEWSVDDASRTVHVRLPEFRILSNEIDEDSLRLYHEDLNIFTPMKVEYFNAAQKALKEQGEADAIANGLFEEAEDNAKRLIEAFIAPVYPPESYRVEFD